MPLPNYLSEEPQASAALQQERKRWKLNFHQWGWLWDEPRIAELGNDPLPPWIRLPSERVNFGDFVRRFLSYEKGLALCLLVFACYGIFTFFLLVILYWPGGLWYQVSLGLLFSFVIRSLSDGFSSLPFASAR